MNTFLTRLMVVASTTISLSAVLAQQADAISFNFNWQGDGGYSATGIFSYDETTAPIIISENGGGPTNTLESLMVSFFDPSNNLLQSFNSVTGGVSQSPFFQFNFDTSTQTLFGAFNVGGGTGVIGEQFLLGTIGAILELRQDVDQMGTSIVLDQNSGTIIVSQQVPEPTSVFSLWALGFLGAASIMKKRLTH